ncbi:hypothetical protein Tco_1332231 [Tanacetum coccineum]
MELVLEQTQQGTSYEVSVSAEGVEELKRKVKIKGEKKEALLTLRQKPVTHWFTLIVLSALRRFDNENMLSLMNLTNVLERFYTLVGNPVKEILLKLNLPDQRLLKDRGEAGSRGYRQTKSITICLEGQLASGARPKVLPDYASDSLLVEDDP